ncbi:MAG TPA: hypothetical protein VL095_14425 [Flavisolibacter sp.]|nr:hypothetical protein [Flavisolibacter sp.]
MVKVQSNNAQKYKLLSEQIKQWLSHHYIISNTGQWQLVYGLKKFIFSVSPVKVTTRVLQLLQYHHTRQEHYLLSVLKHNHCQHNRMNIDMVTSFTTR